MNYKMNKFGGIILKRKVIQSGLVLFYWKFNFLTQFVNVPSAWNLNYHRLSYEDLFQLKLWFESCSS